MTINYLGTKTVVLDVDLASGDARLTINAPNTEVVIIGHGPGALILDLNIDSLCVTAPQSLVEFKGEMVNKVSFGCIPASVAYP